MLDIFNENAFSVVSLTDAINKVKFVPGRIGSLGLFTESSVSTLSIAMEEKNGVLSLIAPSPRGGPGSTMDRSRRTLRNISIPHFQIDDAVMADSVQGIRAFGSETQLETVMGKVLEVSEPHVQSLAATQEYSRIGALKGLVTYADGTTLDLFDFFDVEQITERDWDLDNASPTGGILRETCAAVYRQIAGVLEGIPFSGIHAFCGDAFFDDLISHTEVRASYLQQQEASQLRTGYIDGGAGGSFGSFNFGGITWENYRGSVGDTSFINTDKAHFFPTGVPQLFRTYYAPADYIETVNTMGRRIYEKLFRMPNDKGMNMEIQMNSLEMCTRPRCLLVGRRT
jgi:hypothetical protein